MRGTNTGSLRRPPTHRRQIALPGIDVIRVSERQDRQPAGLLRSSDDAGATRAPGGRTASSNRAGHVRCQHPGQVGELRHARRLSLTMVDAQSDEEVQEIRLHSRRIMLQMPSMPGFLVPRRGGGTRLYTVSAWSEPEQAHRIMLEDPHKKHRQRSSRGTWAPHSTAASGSLTRSVPVGCGVPPAIAWWRPRRFPHLRMWCSATGAPAILVIRPQPRATASTSFDYRTRDCHATKPPGSQNYSDS